MGTVAFQRKTGFDEESFRLLVSSIKDYAIFMLDPNGHILTWNAGAEHINGYKAHEIVGKHFSIFYTEKDIKRNHPQRELAIALLDGRFEEEGWRVRKDGTIFWANVVITTLRDGTGKHRGFAKVTRDLTQRKLFEDSLAEKVEERTQRLNMVLQATDIGLWYCDLPLDKLNWDERVKAHFFLPSTADVTLGVFFDRIHPEDHERVEKAIKGAVEEGAPYRIDFRTVDPTSNKFYWIRSIGSVSRDTGGRSMRFDGITVNITKQKLAEEGLHDAIRARDEFLSIASHELKTPLTTLKLQAQMRNRSIARNDTQTFTLEKIKKMVINDDRQIDRLIRLVDDMLDISRLRTGRLTLNFEKFDLTEALKELIERLKQQFESKKSSISLVADQPIFGVWDRVRVEQIVTNLLTNALRYGADKPIEISLRSAGDSVEILVKDQGIGIAKVDQKRVFERFERAVSASEVSGLGLGLFISRQIAEGHGGSISVESELGEGALFTVRLPLISK